MRPGDLVTLSAYGKKIKRTGWVRDGDVGIIKECRGAYDFGSYKIHWCGSSMKYGIKRDYITRGSHWDWSPIFDRRDLKFVKKKP